MGAGGWHGRAAVTCGHARCSAADSSYPGTVAIDSQSVVDCRKDQNYYWCPDEVLSVELTLGVHAHDTIHLVTYTVVWNVGSGSGTGVRGMLDTTSHTRVVTLPSEAVAYVLAGHLLTVMPKKSTFARWKKKKCLGIAWPLSVGQNNVESLYLGLHFCANTIWFSCQCIKME